MTLLYKECLSRELQDLQTVGRGARQRTSLFHPGHRTDALCGGFKQKEIKIEIWSKTSDQEILRNLTHAIAQLLFK